VSKEEHWKRVVADIVAAHRRVDVLVNNAGIAVYDAVHDCSTENWRKVLGVNQDGCFFGMREVIPHMKAHKSGSIINVSSIWGTAAVPGAHAYHATKGALVMMSKNAAISYVGDGIRVNSIHPGFIDTPLTQAQDPAINANVIALTPMKRAGTPLEIANGCLPCLRRVELHDRRRTRDRRRIPCSVARAVTVERAFRMPEPVNQESSADYFR
jgi:3alpha(or 20beta)-hydroxysteroid dehydrogenase